MQLRSASSLWLSLVILISVWCAHAKKDTPRITSTIFEGQPTSLQFFEDTNIILVQERDVGLVWRSDDGGETWDKVKDVERGQAKDVWLHPFSNQVAYILGSKDTHWVSEDQGKSWSSFRIDGVQPSYGRGPPLGFHARDSSKVIFNGVECNDHSCTEVSYYTTDHFQSNKLLRKDSRGCMFARSTSHFTTSEDDRDDNRVVCVVQGFSPSESNNRLLISDNYFENEEEPALEQGRTVKGLISTAAVKGFIVAATKSETTSELALYVTDDAATWHRAEFPHNHRLEEGAYTILESTNYSLQVDVMTTKPISAMGVLCTSNSNGTYFTENIRHTNRNFYPGIVDFEQIQNIHGIVMVNVVDNWEEVERTSLENKKIQSKISFDDGRTFRSLIVKDGKKDLHLHSVTTMVNVGKVFSSAAPGIVMGVGNTGDFLRPYSQGDLYVSDDAGLTWELALKEAHKYEFGDQGSVLLAVYDEGPTNEISWSINHGKDWGKMELDEKIRAGILTTTPDSTSLKFVLLGSIGGGSSQRFVIYSIDFEGLHERICEEDDFEDWVALRDENGNPGCLMGHTQTYRRRKSDADCFIEKEFIDPVPKFEQCPCKKEDYECDYNFVKSDDGKNCILSGPLRAPENQCKSDDDKFKGTSGYRLIPGNHCTRNNGEKLDEEIERPCRDTYKPPTNGKISHEYTQFKATGWGDYAYLERSASSSGNDETIVMHTDDGKAYRTTNHGKVWRLIPELEGVKVSSIVPSPYDKDVVYFLTRTKKAWRSDNRGATLDGFETEHDPLDRPWESISFRPDHRNTIIWTGTQHCDDEDSTKCHSVAQVSEDGGDHWKTLLRYVSKCEFIKPAGRGDSKKLIYCGQHKDKTPKGQLELWSSEDFFDTKKRHFENIVGFATTSEFIIVANKDENQRLKVDTSIDGKTFADAKFPPDFDVPDQRAYTVLDSSTHAVFLHVTVSSKLGFEYGRIMKSNSNGTNYVLSMAAVNRNSDDYVDFEKMQGLEGVAVVNIVDNLQDEKEGKAKKLKTLITHNDGAEWAPLTPPTKDADGKAFDCISDDCSLHLHGYTERADPRDTFSSPSAVGLMLGNGNVGTHLTNKAAADLFMSNDGGLNWFAVRKGQYLWEFGDQGSIVVIVEDGVETNVIYYTLDEGKTWDSYQFADHKMKIADLTTIPSDLSRNFLLWAVDGRTVATINLDFSELRTKTCFYDKDNLDSEENDYWFWEPSHPAQEQQQDQQGKCLFGHVAQYARKKIARQCWNMLRVEHPPVIQNCTCTRQDYECDYNYQLDDKNYCTLIDGLNPLNHSRDCADDPDLVYWSDPTGFRRVPLSTCQGGKELDVSQQHICPGHEQQYEREHGGLRGFALFVVAVLLPVTIAAGIGYYVWTRCGGKFGRIRLGDSGGALDASQPWIHYPVAAISALVAVIAAIPLLVSSIWRSASGLFGGGRRYTTRQSFARGRGDYAIVDPDEDELLGDDEEDEV